MEQRAGGAHAVCDAGDVPLYQLYKIALGHLVTDPVQQPVRDALVCPLSMAVGKSAIGAEQIPATWTS